MTGCWIAFLFSDYGTGEPTLYGNGRNVLKERQIKKFTFVNCGKRGELAKDCQARCGCFAIRLGVRGDESHRTRGAQNGLAEDLAYANGE